MKRACATLLALLAGLAAAEDENPLGKVIELMDSLTAKLTADGEAEDKAFREYVEWGDDTTKNQQYEIKTATTKKEELEATSAAEAAEGKIEDLAGKIAQAESELKDATLVREKEASDFAAAEGELTEA